MKIIFLSTFTALTLLGNVYGTFESHSFREASLGMNASGIAKTVLAQNADYVKKGDVLLQLDNTDETLALQINRANYDALKKEVVFLTEQHARYKKSEQVFDKNTLDKLSTELNVKLSQLQSSKLNVAFAEQKLSKMRLVAPFSGTISEKLVEEGDMVSAMGSHPLFKLISKETKILIQFDSKYLKDVKVGYKFFPVVDGIKASNYVKITKIYPTINTKTHQMTAEANGNGLLPGTFGDGSISK